MKIEDAVNTLIKELLNDEDYYNVWQANIAMSFMDEYNRATSDGKFLGIHLHGVANNAAKCFLNNLTYSVRKEEKS